MSIEEIKKECECYQSDLETCIPTEINAAIERGVNIAVYHARIGQMFADAKLLSRKKRSAEISNAIIKIAKENYLSAKAQNALIESIAEEELYLVDWLERLNSMCVHQMDLIRSIISKEKEEMKYQNFRG
jgi:hypothetical protein